MELEKIVEKHVLKNAMEHAGKADAERVFSKIVVEAPEAKGMAEEVMKKIELTIRSVNNLSPGEQKIKLMKIDPSMLEDKPAEIKELKLEGVKGKVVMRYAPNPNSGMHIGNARVAVLNDFFVKKYGGKFILRFDDTDPKNEDKKPAKEAYEQIKKDLEWLGVEVHEVHAASERFERYYAVFQELIDKGKAYICTCPAEEWAELRRIGTPCACRSNSIYENNRKWKMMVFGDFKQETAVGRLKTDMKWKDPAQRDWVCFRIIEKPNHPMTKNKYYAWPLLDFASAIDDHDFSVTNILRGQDLSISEKRQTWLYDYMHWTYPHTTTLGHLGIAGAGKFSKSQMRAGIKEGKYSGWDDPQLPMIASYRRRGFHPEAIRKMITDSGLTGGKINLSEEIISSYNKKIIDAEARRYFFVENPQKILVKGLKKELIVPNHPSNPALGERKISVDGKVYISKNDVPFLKKTVDTRLIDLGNVKLVKPGEVKLSSNQDVTKESQKIQWVSKGEECELLQGKDAIKGMVEEAALEEKIGSVMQFMRIGFVRLDSKKPLRFVFGHK